MPEEEKDLKQQEEKPQQKDVEPETQQEDNDQDFIDSLLKDEDEPINEKIEEEDKKKKEEEQRLKNKNAEEARKRREAEAKAKKQKEAEEAKRKEEEEKAQKEKEALEKQQEEKDKEEKNSSANQKRLGEQLVDFKKKHPEVDLGQLDSDKSFKRFIDGKLLGKKDFNELYEEFVEFKSELSGKDRSDTERNYKKKKSSSGSSSKGGGEDLTDVYSEQELKRISEKLPYMTRKEAAKVEKKLNRSIEYYDKN